MSHNSRLENDKEGNEEGETNPTTPEIDKLLPELSTFGIVVLFDTLRVVRSSKERRFSILGPIQSRVSQSTLYLHLFVYLSIYTYT